MKYLLLLYVSEDRLWELGGREQQDLLDGLGDFIPAAGFDSFYRLESTGAALTLRRRSDGLVLSGGCGIDAEEQLQACALVEVADLNAAVRMAAQLPAAALGSIEVRPVRVLGLHSVRSH